MRCGCCIVSAALRWAPVVLTANAACALADAHAAAPAALACVATLILAVAASIDTPVQRS